MGLPDFGQPPTPLIAQHLHDEVNVVDGDVAEGVHHGLLVEPEPELGDPLGCRWRVPLSWTHNSYSVLALYRDQLDVETLD